MHATGGLAQHFVALKRHHEVLACNRRPGAPFRCRCRCVQTARGPAHPRGAPPRRTACSAHRTATCAHTARPARPQAAQSASHPCMHAPRVNQHPARPCMPRAASRPYMHAHTRVAPVDTTVTLSTRTLPASVACGPHRTQRSRHNADSAAGTALGARGIMLPVLHVRSSALLQLPRQHACAACERASGSVCAACRQQSALVVRVPRQRAGHGGGALRHGVAGCATSTICTPATRRHARV
jgi:hypothetical protein